MEPETGRPGDGDDHGRVGYGRYAKYTPLGLALVILGALLVIGLNQRGQGAAPESLGGMIGKPAPDVTLTTFAGEAVALGGLRGSVVVVNFWAEWCAPCREEMPAFEAIHRDASGVGAGVAILGVDIKKDWPAKSRPFAASLGITYPVGQDTGGDDSVRGPIQLAFGVAENYPTTVFIRPDGVIDDVRLGAMDTAEIAGRIAHARSESAAAVGSSSMSHG